MAIAEKPNIATVKLGNLEVTRFIIGGNPFSGFGHQDGKLDEEMVSYYTAERIKQTYHQAEKLGVTTCVARTDKHIVRLMREYWEEGGTIQWIGQTAPELGPAPNGARQAIGNGARAVFVHGGETDHLYHQGKLGDLQAAINMIHEAGLPAGVAGHQTAIFEYAEEHLNCDFYMCSYYNPTSREQTAEHVTQDERFRAEDREKMTAFIQKLTKPVIHYKILAAGRTKPEDAFAFAARAMRKTDAVCVGIFTKHRRDEIAEDIGYLKEGLKAVGQEG
jgi:hypothetical protein